MVNKYVRITLACSLAVLTALSAQIKFNIGPVPYTMQNFAVILSGLLLGKFGALAQLIYLGMIAIGIPAGAGGDYDGIGHSAKWTARIGTRRHAGFGPGPPR